MSLRRQTVLGARPLAFGISVALLVGACSLEDEATGSRSSVAGSGGSGGSAGSAGAAATAPSAGAGMDGSGGTHSLEAGGSTLGASGTAGDQSDAGGVGITDGGGPGLNELARAIDGFRMDLKCVTYVQQPCEPQNAATPNRGYLCCNVDQTAARTNHPPVDKDLAFGGDPTKLYDVTLRVRGVFENYDYGAMGTKQGDFVRIGGTRPAPYKIHVFGATVGDPQLSYFFNSWNDTSNPARIYKADYEVTLRMRGGTKVRFFEYDDIGRIWRNAENLKVEGLPPYPEAFDGQFMQFSVVSVNPQ